MTPISLRLGDQTLDLLPERAAFWREASVLLVADCHLGKAASFRSQGMAVPEGGTAEDLDRLDLLIKRTGARRLLVVGDFFHSPTGYSADVIDQLMEWRGRHEGLRITLVPGNHDRQLHRLPSSLRLEVAPDPHAEGGFCFLHDPSRVPFPASPRATDSLWHVCGHLHPAIRLGDRRVRGLRAPCFWLERGATLVLPSFGSFTGSVVVSPGPGDRVFAVASGRVLEVPGLVWGAETATGEK